METKIIETQFAILIQEVNFLKTIYKNNINISIENAIEIVNERLAITSNELHKVLVIIPKKIEMSKAARDYLSGPEGIKNLTATAIVVNSKYSNFITKLFVKLIPPPIPTKIFSTEAKALEWLNKI